jgi:hypothetical protein
MTPSERLRACYQHAALRWMSGERATNASLRQRFGVANGEFGAGVAGAA